MALRASAICAFLLFLAAGCGGGSGDKSSNTGESGVCAQFGDAAAPRETKAPWDAPGDAMALRANPTLLARLTGGKAPAIRSAALTAGSTAELPPPEELADGLVKALGIPRAVIDFEEAKSLPGSITVSHT